MNNTGLIVKREYLRRVRKKSFLLITFLMPFLIAGVIFIPLWLAGIKGDEVRQVAVIDATGKYASLFKDTETYRFLRADKTLEEYRKKPDKEIFAFLSISGDLLENPKAATLYSEKQVPGELSRLVNQVLTQQMEREKLASFQIPNLQEIIRQSRVDFNIQTIKWGEDGSENTSSAAVASMIGVIFTMLIYMFILFYGAMVMQGVMEEKTNRIVEVMISSVRPFDLMMGKILGIGLVGLTQMFMWAIMTFALLTGVSFLMGGSGGMEAQAVSSDLMAANPGMAALADPAAQQQGNEFLQMLQTIDFTEIGLFFILYFIGGYMLYASMFAAIGSAVDSQEDTQQFMAPVTIFMVFALYAGIYSMENPDGPLAFWCSMIPFTSPIVMMVRIPFDIPLWEKLVSVFLLYASFIAITWLSAKIYRVGILMYGKKPSLKEMVKWIRYK